MRDVQGYIRQVYLIHNAKTKPYFQIQYLYISIPTKLFASVQRSLFRTKRNMRKFSEQWDILLITSPSENRKLDKTEHGEFSDFERQNAAVSSCERQQKYHVSNFQKGVFRLAQFTMIFKCSNFRAHLLNWEDLRKYLLEINAFTKLTIMLKGQSPKYSLFIVHL